MARKETKKGFSREERLKAAREGFKDLDKRGGSYFLLDDKDFEEMGIKKFVPEEGSSFVAILPRIESPRFYKEIYVHYGIGPNKNSYLCPAKMYDEPCPVCQYREQLIKQGVDKEEFKEYYPSRRCLMWVVNMKNKRSIAEGVFLYDAPPTIIKGISEVVVDERSDEIITDICDDDINFVFRRKGTKFNTKYSGFKLEDRDEQVPEEYYEDLPEMDELLVDPDVKEMGKVIGLLEEDDRFDEEEEKLSKRSSHKSGRKSSRREKLEDDIDDEDDLIDPDEDIDEPISDDEEEERPRSHRSGKSSRREEPEDDIDEDEEEEPTPKSRRRAGRKKDFIDDIENPDDESEEEERSGKRDNVRSKLKNRKSRRR